MILRTYQARVLDELWAWFHKHDTGNPIVNAVVGAGKSVLIAALAQRAMSEYPGTRILVIVHQKELLQQNLEKLTSVWPEAPVGVHSASVGKKDIGHDILYATIGSIYKKAHLLGRVDLILADECFTGDTLVSTPNGDKRIDSLRCGDSVYNQQGIGIVKAVSAKPAVDIYRLEFDDGTEIKCTGDHPFFTGNGFVKARELEIGESFFSIEGMRFLWEAVRPVGEDERERTDGVRLLGAKLEKANMLLDIVCKEIEEPDEQQPGEATSKGKTQGDQAQAYKKRRERAIAALATACSSSRAWGGMGVRSPSENDDSSWAWLSDVVQNRHSKPSSDDWNRDRRRFAHNTGEEGPGREKNGLVMFPRLVNISNIKSGCATSVFNIHVSGHPSYFANGKAVHNCHLINSKEAGIWRQFIADMRRYNPNTRVIGWTGTPFRGDGVWLTAGEEPLFHGIAAKVTMRELIDAGYLAPLVPGGVKMTMSADGVSVVNGDYKISELAARVDRSELVEEACDEIVQLAADRKRWLVFCVTVEHAHHVNDALVARGVASAVVSAETLKADRERIIEAFRAGRLRCLCNVAVLTTGFDVPEVDCIALLRNTRSPVLYVQIAGRGMRVVGADIVESVKNGKADTLWLDFTDTTANLGPVDAIQGRGPKRKMAHEKPVKLCEECGSINAVSARECIDCGAPFEIVEADPHGTKVSNAAIMSGHSVFTRYSVDRVTYAKHNKPGKPPSLRVEYWHGLRVVAKEWVGIESDNHYAKSRASHWWWQRTRGQTPNTVDQALCIAPHIEKCPSAIVVNESGKYPEIISFEWEKQHEQSST